MHVHVVYAGSLQAVHVFSNDIHAHSEGGCPVEKRKSLVLDKLEVVCAGDEVELRQLCPMVESIYLSGNHLTHWTDVSQSPASYKQCSRCMKSCHS